MAVTYTKEMKEAAFDLYCEGRSVKEIVNDLSDKYGSQQAPALEEIRRWRSRGRWWHRREKLRGPPDRKNRDSRKEEMEQKAAAKVERERAIDGSGLMDDLIRLQTKIVNAVELVDFTNSGQAVKALELVRKMIVGLKAEQQEGQTPSTDPEEMPEQMEEAVQAAFALIGEDEEVGPVLARRAGAILDKIEERGARGEGRGARGEGRRAWSVGRGAKGVERGA